MKLLSVSHALRRRRYGVLLVVLMFSMWANGCRVDDESCTSNDMCAQTEVCSSAGVCEPHEVRMQERRELFQRFGADVGAYSLWLRYGTAGARISEEGNSEENNASYAHGEAFSLDSEAAFMSHDENAPHVLCSLEDVRTDDLLFTYNRAYPGGYWGGTPIADQHGGRCGGDLETLAWRLLNCERLTRHLPPVDCDLRLVWIGRQHADDMASRNFFGHINPDGQDSFHRLSGRGIHYGLAGENLARQRSIFDAHAAWMGSPLHRRNILTEQYHYAGIGVIPHGRQLMLSEAFVGGIESEGGVPPDNVPPDSVPPDSASHQDSVPESAADQNRDADEPFDTKKHTP